jgi:hypothetical protein
VALVETNALIFKVKDIVSPAFGSHSRSPVGDEPGPIVKFASIASSESSPAALKAGKWQVQPRVKNTCSLCPSIGRIALYSTLKIRATRG